MELTLKDLERLKKNGIGGFTTLDEQMTLIVLATEALEARQLKIDFENRFGGLADREIDAPIYCQQFS